MSRPALAEEIAWLIRHLRAMVATAPATWARHHTLTLTQLTALHVIHADNSLTLTGLADALGTRVPATSAMVDRLATAGMLHRAQDHQHRSRIRLQLTAEAAHMLGDIDTTTATRFQHALQALNPQQHQDAAAFFANLISPPLIT